MNFITLCVIGLFAMTLNSHLTFGSNDFTAGGVANAIHYSRETLLFLRDHLSPDSDSVIDSIPSCVRVKTKKPASRKRRRGCRGGTRRRLRRLKNKLPLPTTLLINAQSLRAKTDELFANTRFLHEYRSACVLAVTETWLDNNIQSREVEPAGFSAYRVDRDPAINGKARGGGVCLLIRDEWCRSVVVREHKCTPDIELLCISLRPYYLPREFPQIFFTVLYIHPKANFNKATEVLYNLSQKLESLSPDAPKFFLGDFNNCPVKKSLRTYYQYVDCPTRKNKTLDMCFGNVKSAYTATVLPPLGASDHSVVYLRPVYKRLLEREKPQSKTVKVWSTDSIMALQGCFECTVWELFTSSDLNDQVTVVSDYITFCVDSVIPTKTFKVYPNDKPWVSNKLKELLIKKKKAYKKQDETARRELQGQIKRQIQMDKHIYKQKIEASLASGNSRLAWQGVKTMTNVPHKGKGKSSPGLHGAGGVELANQLNHFFCRFEGKVSAADAVRKEKDTTSVLTINVSEVFHLFRDCNPRKSPGPDQICGFVLKNCAQQLAPVFTHLFNRSLENHSVPTLWKSSIIVPVPKISRPAEPNDFRPIALTSLVMKCFERIVKRVIISQTQHQIDPLQFAYQASRGVEDAVLTMLQLLYTHLEKPKAHAKILFVDFSSAFNTIQPHILTEILTNDFLISQNLVLWITDFLKERVQQVRAGLTLSDKITTNTGSPQGCVLSSTLFILYTNSCTSNFPNRHFIKYADDTALVSLLQDEEEEHGPVLDFFINWCKKSKLILNTTKTKEIAIDFRKNKSFSATFINGEQIQSVTSYKYLGIVVDCDLKWDVWADCISTKAQQRLYFLKKLVSFNVNNKMLLMFYSAFIESILTFCSICWFGNATETQKRCLRRTLTTASKLLCITLPTLEQIYRDRVIKKARNIVADTRHPLSSSFKLLPSGRRYCQPFVSRNRTKFSFVPQATKLLNVLKSL